MAGPSDGPSQFRRSTSKQMPPPTTDAEPHHVDWENIYQVPTQWTARQDSVKGNYSGSVSNVPTLKKKLKEVVGPYDFNNPNIWRASVVEFAGTAALTFMSIAAAITCQQQAQSHGSSTSAATFPTVQVLIYSFCILATAPVSGGHLNPAVTFATFLTGHATLVRSLFYLVAQTAGGILGAYLVKNIISADLESTHHLGGCLLKDVVADQSTVGLSHRQGTLAEVVFTFIFIFVSYQVSLEPRSLVVTWPIVGPFVIGTVFALLNFVSRGLASQAYTGAGMNPAKCFGPAVVYGRDLWDPQPVFWSGPLFAAMAFALIHHLVLSRNVRDFQPGDYHQPLLPLNFEYPMPVGDRVLTDMLHGERPASPVAGESQEPKKMNVVLHIKAAMLHPGNSERNIEDGRMPSVSEFHRRSSVSEFQKEVADATLSSFTTVIPM